MNQLLHVLGGAGGDYDCWRGQQQAHGDSGHGNRSRHPGCYERCIQHQRRIVVVQGGPMVCRVLNDVMPLHVAMDYQVVVPVLDVLGPVDVLRRNG